MKYIKRRSKNAAASALAILLLMGGFQNCGEMGKATNPQGSQEFSSTAEQGKILYTQNCAACHGPVETSQKRSRTVALINLALTSEPAMAGVSPLTPAQIEAIASALSNNTQPVPPTGNARQIFACNANDVQKTPLAKLTNREFRTALTLLLDDLSPTLKADTQLNSLLNSLPSDIVAQDRNTLKEQSLLNTQPNLNATFEAAFHAGGLAAGSPAGLQSYPGTNQCLALTSVSQSCHQSFVAELGRRAFRRPLTNTEAAALATSLWDSSLSKSQLIQLTFTSIVLMPDFLYKPYDRGTATSLGATVLNLTAHELAAKVSFFLTGAPPDATLRGLADSGAIRQPDILSQQVDRLLTSAGARAMVQRFFRESYGHDVYDNFLYDSAYLNGINTSGLRDAMNQELDTFFSSTVLTQQGTFHQLMSSTATNVTNPGLAAIYGVAPGTTNLPAERAGFLNRAALLTKRSGFRATPIKRGLKILEHVLCEEVGLPPPSAPTSLPAVEGQILSTREQTHRVSEIRGTACFECHTKMNNLGYPLEGFDSLGRLRTQESIFDGSGNFVARVPINTEATTAEVRATPITVANSRDLSENLGRSDRALMCFVKHLKRFESRVPVTAAAHCQMNESLNVLYGSNGNQGPIVEAIKRMVLSADFARWSY